MASLNKVLIIGNVTRDIEVRYLPNGTAVCDIGIAINRTWTDNGEKKEEVTFVDVTFFGRKAEVLSEYCQKGSPILVEGHLKLDKWEDQNGGGNRQKLKVVCDNLQLLGQPKEYGTQEAQEHPQEVSQETYGPNSVDVESPF